jgi:hypothetical protein
MTYITNNNGTTSGNHNAGNRVVNFGSKLPQIDEGSPLYVRATQFDGTKAAAINTITGTYSDRFDDMGYYE